MLLKKTSYDSTTPGKKEGITLLVDQLIDDAINKEAFNYNKMFNMFEELKIIFSERKFEKLKISISEYKTNDEMVTNKNKTSFVFTPKDN